MKTERVKNSVFNSISNLLISFSVTILSFILRTIFIKMLGEQCLGLEGLFTNILTLLSLAELGFTLTISFSLYDPLSKKDYRKIKLLLNYFKKVYRKIGSFIFITGILCMPLLPRIAKGYTVSYNIYIIFLLFLINTSLSYFTSYNFVLLEADQKKYKITHIRLICSILLYGLQIISLVVFKNFIIYILILIIMKQAEKIVTYMYIRINYKEVYNIDEKSEKLDPSSKKSIEKNIKGVLFHKIGDFAVNGTDNILISSIINISITGIYANYLSIVGVIKTFINSLISASTATFGNLNVEESIKVKNNVFNVINMISGITIGICTICFFCIANDFVLFWVGKRFVLGTSSVIIISANIFLACMLIPIDVVKNSTGLYYIDRYIGIIQAFVNLIASIIFGKLFGLNGILIGTTISYLTTVTWTKPYMVYKYIFKESFVKYIRNLLLNICMVVFICIVSNYIFRFINIKSSVFLLMIIKCLICSICYVILYTLVYHQTEQFKYIKGLVFNTNKR